MSCWEVLGAQELESAMRMLPPVHLHTDASRQKVGRDLQSFKQLTAEMIATQ